MMNNASTVYNKFIAQSAELYGLAIIRGQGGPHEAYNIYAFLDFMEMVYGPDPMKLVRKDWSHAGVINSIRIDVMLKHERMMERGDFREQNKGQLRDWFKQGKLNPNMPDDIKWLKTIAAKDLEWWNR